MIFRIALGTLVVAAGLSMARESQGAEGAEEGVKYALLVGVERYEHNELRPLRYAEADVTELSVVLRDAGFRRKNVVLLGESQSLYETRFLPRRANIVREIDRLFARCTAKDSVVIAFAGHGLQFRGSSDSYFCPSDAKVAERDTLISLDELYKSLEKCPAQSKLLLVDACRNELVASTRARQTVDLESVTRPRGTTPPAGTAAFFSCSATQVAYESDLLKHGVFFNFVIEGLRGEADLDKDHEITLPELELFVKGRTSQHVRKELGGAEQMPDLSNHTRGLMQLVKWDRLQEGYWDFFIDDSCNVPGAPSGLAHPRTPIVTGVSRGGDSEKAGLRRGDVILSIDGQVVRSTDHLIQIERGRRPGTSPALKVLRDGKELVVPIRLGPLPTMAQQYENARRNAERGEAWAMTYLGDLAFEGKGTARNSDEAMKWYQKAADAGYSLAWLRLADAHTHGRGREKSARLEIECYRQAAALGDPFGQLFLARALLTGRGVARDDVEGMRLLRSASDRRLPAAQYQLAQIYREGKLAPRDLNEAVRLTRLAAEEEYGAALTAMGFFYDNGEGVEKDAALAKIWLEKAAASDQIAGWAGLAKLASQAKDDAELVRCTRRGAELDDTSAQFWLGQSLERGLGATADAVEAARWYRIAAEKNSARAQSALASLYSRGVGVPQRSSEAIIWWEKAAKQGDAEALYRLGLELRSGANVAKDEAKGLSLLKEAAAKNHAEAQAEVKRLTAPAATQDVFDPNFFAPSRSAFPGAPSNPGAQTNGRLSLPLLNPSPTTRPGLEINPYEPNVFPGGSIKPVETPLTGGFSLKPGTQILKPGPGNPLDIGFLNAPPGPGMKSLEETLKKIKK